MKEAAKRGGLFATSVVGAAEAAGPDVKATRATMVSRMAVVAQAASVRSAVPSRPAAASDLNPHCPDDALIIATLTPIQI
jgi:hypothetical protein